MLPLLRGPGLPPGREKVDKGESRESKGGKGGMVECCV